MDMCGCMMLEAVRGWWKAEVGDSCEMERFP